MAFATRRPDARSHLERDYGLTEGNIFQGCPTLNQLFASRPGPGLGGYDTPVKGLFMCGAATHPGGAVIGARGRNGAQVESAFARVGFVERWSDHQVVWARSR